MSGAALGVGGLDAWLGPFLEVLGHKKRRASAPLYLRGLLGLPVHDQLHRFVSSPAWGDGPL